MKPHDEPAIVKARKLAALADRGATEGERSNAADMLEKHLRRCGLTLQDLSDAALLTFRVDAIESRKQARKDLQMATLAYQLARFIAGKQDLPFECWQVPFEVPTRGLKVKVVRIYVVSVELTRAEGADWQECFRHYAPMLGAALRDLREKERAARKAVKMALPGLLNRFDLFAPDTPVAKARADAATHFAMMAAMRAANGEAWVKKSGYLDQPNLLECSA